MKNQISEQGSGEPDCEPGLAYTIGPGKDGKESLMFVFQRTVEECREMFEQLYQKTAVITGPEEEVGTYLIASKLRTVMQRKLSGV